MKTRPPQAFTLVEFIFVIAIIGVLTGISFPAYRAIRNSNNKKAAASEIALFKVKLNDFKLDYGFLPRATFITGTPPQSVQEPGIYDADPTDETYLQAGRALFLALTGRTTYDDVEDSKGRDYLKPRAKGVGSPSEAPEGGDIYADEKKTYEEQTFDSGSYLVDPWGNPYGFYYNPDDAKWKSFHSPSTFDIWSTAGQIEDTSKSRSKWVTSW